MDVKELAAGAAAYIRENGWNVGVLVADAVGDESACLLGACAAARYGSPDSPEAYDDLRPREAEFAELLDELASHLPDGGYLNPHAPTYIRIYRFNDAAHRTQEEVLDFLDSVANGQ